MHIKILRVAAERIEIERAGAIEEGKEIKKA